MKIQMLIITLAALSTVAFGMKPGQTAVKETADVSTAVVAPVTETQQAPTQPSDDEELAKLRQQLESIGQDQMPAEEEQPMEAMPEEAIAPQELPAAVQAAPAEQPRMPEAKPMAMPAEEMPTSETDMAPDEMPSMETEEMNKE